MGNNLDFTVGMRVSAFRRGLDQLRQDAAATRDQIRKDFSRNVFGSIAGAIAGAFTVGAVKNFLAEMDRVQTMADRFGASAVDIQKVGKAAELADVQMSTVGKTTLRLAAAAAKAVEGGKAQVAIFRDLNVSAKEYAASDLAGRVMLLAQGYDKAKASGQGVERFIAALGPKGAEMVQLLASGADELGRLLKSIPAMGDGAVQRFAMINDQLDEMKATAAGVLVPFVKHLEIGYEMVKAMGKSLAQPFHGKAITEERDRNIAEIELKYEAKDPGQKKPKETGADADDREAGKRVEQLRAQIAEAERKAKLEVLSVEERLTELYRERDALLKNANDDTEEGLEAKRKALELDREAQTLSEDAANKREQGIKKGARNLDRLREELRVAEEADADQEEKNKFDALPDNKAKAKFLEDKQARLYKESTSDLIDSDDEGLSEERRLELRTSAAKKHRAASALESEINGYKKEEPQVRHAPRVFASQYAQAGLGGHAAASGGDKQVEVQKQLLSETKKLVQIMSGATKQTPERGPAFAGERHSALRTGSLRTGGLRTGRL